MFRHDQSRERRGGIRWRLDLLALDKYLEQKGYEERARERDMFDKVQNLKMEQLTDTINALEEMVPDDLDFVYEKIATLWS